MRPHSRHCLWIAGCLIIVLGAANIQRVGRAASQHYDWKCGDCKVYLYVCPGKKVKALEVPATYRAHAHDWKQVNTTTIWSAWKPWQWFVFLNAKKEMLEVPNPNDVFRSAHPRANNSDEQGLRVLAKAQNYTRSDEAMSAVDWILDRSKQAGATSTRSRSNP